MVDIEVAVTLWFMPRKEKSGGESLEGSGGFEGQHPEAMDEQDRVELEERQLGDLSTGSEADRKTQIGIRLDPEMTKMLSEIRNWFDVRDPEVEFLGEEARGKALCQSDTSVARFILEAGIKHLYGDLEIERIIDYVDREYTRCNGYAEGSHLHWELSEGIASGLSDGMISNLIHEGAKRALDRQRLNDTRVRTSLNAKRLEQRFREKFPDKSRWTETIKQLREVDDAMYPSCPDPDYEEPTPKFER